MSAHRALHTTRPSLRPLAADPRSSALAPPKGTTVPPLAVQAQALRPGPELIRVQARVPSVPVGTLMLSLFGIATAFFATPILRLLPGMNLAASGQLQWSNILVIPLGLFGFGGLPVVLRFLHAITLNLTSGAIGQIAGSKSSTTVLLPQMRAAANRIVSVVGLLIGYWIFVRTFEVLITALTPSSVPGMLVRAGTVLLAIYFGLSTWIDLTRVVAAARRIASLNRTAAKSPLLRDSAGLRTRPARPPRPTSSPSLRTRRN